MGAIPALARADVECEDVRLLIVGGQLDTADVLLVAIEDDQCRAELVFLIDERRGGAARAVSEAERLYEEAKDLSG